MCQYALHIDMPRKPPKFLYNFITDIVYHLGIVSKTLSLPQNMVTIIFLISIWIFSSFVVMADVCYLDCSVHFHEFDIVWRFWSQFCQAINIPWYQNKLVVSMSIFAQHLCVFYITQRVAVKIYESTFSSSKIMKQCLLWQFVQVFVWVHRTWF